MAKAIDWSGLFKKYRGKWLALKGEKTVIAVGDSLQEVYEAARKKGYKIPYVTRMPDTLFSLHSHYELKPSNEV